MTTWSQWRRCWRGGLLGTGLALAACLAWGMPPAIQAGDVADGVHALDRAVEIHEDRDADRTLQDVDSLPSGTPEGFVPFADRARLWLGYSSSAIWLRMSMVNDSQDVRSNRLVLNVSWLQHVDFHVQRWRGGQPVSAWTHERAGIADPPDAGHRHQRVPTLALDLSPGETVRVLVRVRSARQSNLGLELHTAQQWHEIERNHAMLSGLLIGGLLVFAVYSTSLWWISRAPALAYQAGGFAMLALYEAAYRGYARAMLWPDSTEWSYRAHSATAIGTVICLMLYLYERCRNNPVRIPGLPLLAALGVLQALLLVGVVLGTHSTFGAVAFAASPLTVLALTVCAYIYRRRGGPGGRLALAVMSVVCIGTLLRLVALTYASRVLSDIDLYALSFPGMLVGLFAFTAWSYQQTRQRNDAQRTLVQWQAQEQQRLEEEVGRKTHALNEALEQAEQRAREQKELLAYISHDLRAPMATIIGNVRAMQGAGGRPDGQRLTTIERSATYQLDLIDDLLDFSKGDLRPLALDERPVHLRTLIDDIAQYAEALARRQHNTFALDVEGGLPEAVYLDSKRLQQVLLNMLSNAAKFTRDGHIGLQVRAQPAGDAWRLRFEVTDSGAGIGREELDRMKRALADNTPSLQGGLGLVIAQRIVQRMGDRLTIHSDIGTGTQVAFSLEARTVPAELHPAAPQPAARAGAASPGKRKVRDRALPPTAPLSPQQKQELEALARDGRWSDLHAWVNRLAAEEQYLPFVQAVRLALDRLDFEQIRLIARAAPVRAP